jgi:zinc/manganese transport system substrate-binding protein
MKGWSHWIMGLALLLASTTAGATPPTRVVASFSILADMVRQVGGDLVVVDSLVGPDADAHVYIPKPGDAARLAQADLVVVNGLGFEGWIDRLVKASGFKGPVVVASRDVTPLMTEAHSHGHGHSHGARGAKVPDPHAWHDLTRARSYVDVIAQALVAARPGDAARVNAAAEAYSARLRALDNEAKARLELLPIERRKLIVGHQSFAYLQVYGLRQIAAQGVSTESQPSAAQVGRLIQQLRREKAAAVFNSNITSDRLIQRIAAEADAKVAGKLYADALSGPDGPAATLEAMFRHNYTTILAALSPAS